MSLVRRSPTICASLSLRLDEPLPRSVTLTARFGAVSAFAEQLRAAVALVALTTACAVPRTGERERERVSRT